MHLLQLFTSVFFFSFLVSDCNNFTYCFFFLLIFTLPFFFLLLCFLFQLAWWAHMFSFWVLLSCLHSLPPPLLIALFFLYFVSLCAPHHLHPSCCRRGKRQVGWAEFGKLKSANNYFPNLFSWCTLEGMNSKWIMNDYFVSLNLI